jgi:tetratricopeptide (TPR) repeat protein
LDEQPDQRGKPKVRMSYREAAGERLLLELRARDAWNQRAYESAQKLAEELAAAATQDGDDLGWWNATFLSGECLRKQGLMEESRSVADELAAHPLTMQSKALSARVFTLRAFALQGRGSLTEAVDAARSAVRDAEAAPEQVTIWVEAQNALIAALAESGRLEDAWNECLALAELLSKEPNSQTSGLGYWAIGNVAFLLKRITEGVEYHQLAAKNLSPTNDLDLWARFNRGSADFRLAAGIIEPETLECIERAELASSIVGGTERDRLELRLIRAQWLVLTGQLEAAGKQLTDIIDNKHLLASHVAAQAHFLLGQALAASAGNADALADLRLSEELFLQSGADDRATTARALIETIQPQT